MNKKITQKNKKHTFPTRSDSMSKYSLLRELLREEVKDHPRDQTLTESIMGRVHRIRNERFHDLPLDIGDTKA